MITKTSYAPIRMNCYVRILNGPFEGRVGRVNGKASGEDRFTGRRVTLFGVAWADEYPVEHLERITPAEYHSAPDALKITERNRG